jgi:TrmH family RNA methyltransferase
LINQRRARREQGVVVIEGPTLVAEVLADESLRARTRAIYIDSRFADEPGAEQVRAASDRFAGTVVHTVAAGVLERVLDTVAPQPVAAVVATVGHPVTALGVDRPVLVCVDVRDPGNLGTLIRAAEAAGCAGIVLAGHCVDPTSPKVVRAAAGAWLRSVIVEIGSPVDAFDALRSTGRPVIAAALAAGAVSMWEADLARAAIALGNEASGLSPELVAMADSAVSIPFDGPTESLNVGVAGAVLAFESLRQRRAR